MLDSEYIFSWRLKEAYDLDRASLSALIDDLQIEKKVDWRFVWYAVHPVILNLKNKHDSMDDTFYFPYKKYSLAGSALLDEFSNTPFNDLNPLFNFPEKCDYSDADYKLISDFYKLIEFIYGSSELNKHTTLVESIAESYYEDDFIGRDEEEFPPETDFDDKELRFLYQLYDDAIPIEKKAAVVYLNSCNCPFMHDVKGMTKAFVESINIEAPNTIDSSTSANRTILTESINIVAQKAWETAIKDYNENHKQRTNDALPRRMWLYVKSLAGYHYSQLTTERLTELNCKDELSNLDRDLKYAKTDGYEIMRRLYPDLPPLPVNLPISKKINKNPKTKN